jgi:hypothetical protein
MHPLFLRAQLALLSTGLALLLGLSSQMSSARAAETQAKAKAVQKRALTKKGLGTVVENAEEAPSPASRFKSGTFAVEVELTNDEITKSFDRGEFDYDLDGQIVSAHANEVSDNARERLVRAVRDRCKRTGDCKVEGIRGEVTWSVGNGDGGVVDMVEAYRVKYKDGYFFDITHDVGLIEVKIGGLTPERFEAGEKRFQDFLDLASSESHGFRLERGEMHLHEGISSNYRGNITHIRNRFVDKMNHQEFPFIFAQSLDNTPPLSMLPEDRYKALQEIIQQVDYSLLTEPSEFYKALKKRVYDITKNPEWVTDWEPPQKFQYFNTTRGSNKIPARLRTHETRSMMAPKNAKDITDIVKLEAARIKYVASQPAMIELQRFRPRASKELKLGMLKKYIEEAGTIDPSITWESYKRFVPDEWKNVVPAELPGTLWMGESAPRGKCADRVRNILMPLASLGPPAKIEIPKLKPRKKIRRVVRTDELRNE